MRKTLIGCMVATALATVSSAHAQVFSYSFTDTNKAVRNIKPATQTYLNPAGVLTLNLISGLDRYERVTVTRDSDKKVMYSSVSTKTSVSRSYRCCRWNRILWKGYGSTGARRRDLYCSQ